MQHDAVGACGLTERPPSAPSQQWCMTNEDATVTREPCPWKVWGKDLEATSIQQMDNACRLPVSVAGALMPDAHMGYGLPIGGVLATRGAVVPYAVGVDIACRMKMTVLDVPVTSLERKHEVQRLARAAAALALRRPGRLLRLREPILLRR